MMEARVSIQVLAGLSALRFPGLALSAYLPTDPGAGRGYYGAVLDDLARADRHKLDGRERSALRREVPAIVAALEKRRFDSPAVAVFSSRPQEFLRIWRLVEPLPARLAVAGALDLAPLRLQLFERPPALAAIVDKRQARLYSLVLDELTEVGHVEGLPIRRHKRGGWSATALQRRQDEHARGNLGEVAATVSGLLERGGYRRLILAGPPEARCALKGMLPAPALKALTAEGAIPMYASGNELASRLRSLDRT
jgi:Bacterial archaeo-eukaryotic release factor family 10